MKNKYKKNSFKYAAFEVLSQTDSPLSPSEIVKIALEQKLLDSEGATPDATMGAQLYVDIRDSKKSDFIQVGKAEFSLKKTTDTNSPLLLAKQQNEKVRSQLLDSLRKMDPFQFEYLVAELLGAIGFENVSVTKRSGDGGVDVIADLVMGGVTNVKTAVQVKRYAQKNTVAGKTVTQMRGSAEVDQRGLIITTSSFTKAAIEEAKAPNKMPVSLIDGNKLVDLLIDNEIGIKIEQVSIISLKSEFFESNSEDAIYKHDDKYKSIWPLPGGDLSYVETLNSLLNTIGTKGISVKLLNNWFLSEFESVSSAKTISGYINVPKLMGLVKKSGSTLTLTELGVEYSSNQNNERLYKIISDHILAFEEIVDFLKTANSPQNAKDINNFIVSNFDVDWKTTTQVVYRLLWLINLGYVKKQDNLYFV